MEEQEIREQINLKYECEGGYQQIFGKSFVKENKENMELIINGEKKGLKDIIILEKGENNITVIIKKKITNLSYMFYDCKSLKNIEELKYLNIFYCTNFSYMFSGCSSLSNIKSLEKWNVSNGNDFSFMFMGCSSLSEIKSLKNWNVSNGNNFSYMFNGCISLSDIQSLKNWNVSNGKNFKYIFDGCISLIYIK